MAGKVETQITCKSFVLIHGCQNTYEDFAAIGGKVFTEVTSVGGSAITLAESGAGKVTTFAGSVYTVATSAAASAATGYAVLNQVMRLRRLKRMTL